MVCVWDIGTKTLVQKLVAHSDVRSIAVGKDYKHIN